MNKEKKKKAFFLKKNEKKRRRKEIIFKKQCLEMAEDNTLILFSYNFCFIVFLFHSEYVR